MPGLGKSLCTLIWAALVSIGRLDGDLASEPAGVALASAEDAAAQVVVPRLHAADADLERVKLVQVLHDDATGELVLPDGLADLRQLLLPAGVRLLIIDPLVAHLPEGLDGHRDQHVRRVLAPLARLAGEAQVAVVAIMHLNRRASRDALTRINGSGGFGAAARSILLLGPSPDDPKGPGRVLVHAKSNVSPLAPTLRLHIEQQSIGPAGAPVRTAKVVWDGEAPGVTARQVLGGGDDGDSDAVTEAKDALTELLATGPAYAKARAIESKRKQLGIPKRAWQKAKKGLGVRSVKAGYKDGWVWRPPA